MAKNPIQDNAKGSPSVGEDQVTPRGSALAPTGQGTGRNTPSVCIILAVSSLTNSFIPNDSKRGYSGRNFFISGSVK